MLAVLAGNYLQQNLEQITMSLATIFILVVVVFAFYFVTTSPQRRVERESNKADQHIALGGQALLVNDLDRAYSHYQTALYAARSANHPLWYAEACYGLSKVSAHRGDYKSAVSHIDEALTQEQALANGFANYISLLKRVKEEYQAKL